MHGGLLSAKCSAAVACDDKQVKYAIHGAALLFFGETGVMLLQVPCLLIPRHEDCEFLFIQKAAIFMGCDSFQWCYNIVNTNSDRARVKSSSSKTLAHGLPGFMAPAKCCLLASSIPTVVIVKIDGITS